MVLFNDFKLGPVDAQEYIQQTISEYVPENVPKLPIPFEELFKHMFKPLSEDERKRLNSKFPDVYQRENIKPVTFTRKQMSILQNPTQENSIKTGVYYIRDNPSVVSEVLSHSGRGLGMDDVMKYGGAACIGAIFGIFHHLIANAPEYEGEYWIPNPEYDPWDELSFQFIRFIPEGAKCLSFPSWGGAFQGAAIGGVASVAIKATTVVYRNVSNLVQSDGYIRWKKRRDENLTKSFSHEFVSSDEVLSKYVCPITKKIQIFPVKYKRGVGNTYESDQIVKWIGNNPGKIFPGEQFSFRVEDLRYDYAHTNTVFARITDIIHVMKSNSKIYTQVGFHELYKQINVIKKIAREKREIEENKDFKNSRPEEYYNLKFRIEHTYKVVMYTDTGIVYFFRNLLGIELSKDAIEITSEE